MDGGLVGCRWAETALALDCNTVMWGERASRGFSRKRADNAILYQKSGYKKGAGLGLADLVGGVWRELGAQEAHDIGQSLQDKLEAQVRVCKRATPLSSPARSAAAPC